MLISFSIAREQEVILRRKKSTGDEPLLKMSSFTKFYKNIDKILEFIRSKHFDQRIGDEKNM